MKYISLLLGVLLLCRTGYGQLRSTVDLETGNFSQTIGLNPCGDTQGSCDCAEGVSIDVVNQNQGNPVRDGNYSAYHRLRDCHERAEVVHSTAGYNVDTWVGFSLFIPDNAQSRDYNGIIMQLHDRWGGLSPKPPICSGRNSGPTTISVNSAGEVYLHMRYQQGNCMAYRDFTLGRREDMYGKWTDFVINGRFINNANGFIKVWMYEAGADPGEPDATYSGSTYHSKNNNGPAVRTGPYTGNPGRAPEPEFVMYSDEVRIGLSSQGNGFEQVAPSGGTTPPPPKVPVSGVSVKNCPTAALAVGSSLTLGASVAPAEAANKAVSWTSSNPSVASVNSEGVVTTLSEGKTTITATTAQGSFTDECSLSVSASVCSEANLALSGSIHSVSSEQSGNPATNLIDGVADDDANRWSAQSFPQWVILDLGSAQSIGATRLQGYQDRAYQYQVYASSSLSAVESNDPSALVADASSNSADGLVEQRFATTQARYVKVEVVGASNYDGDWVSAREVAVLSSCEEEPEGPSDPGQGSLSIRAQGDCGSEVMELHVDGAKVDEWTVSTAMDDYEYAGFTGGQVSVHLVNDQLEPCDRNLTVDYITVCGSTYQTEEVATETATCCTNNPEKLFTNGNFDFGTLACSSSATPQGATQTQARVDLIKNTTEIEVYPNPGTNGVFRLKNELKGELTVTDLRGRTVAKQPTSDDKTVIDLSGEPNGVYLLRTSTGQTIKLIKE